MLNISIPSATIGKCDELMTAPGDYAAGETTIVITPLRVTFLNENSYKISFGCNFWRSCQNKSCSYCQAGMLEHD
jgi:hypothetical protein